MAEICSHSHFILIGTNRKSSIQKPIFWTPKYGYILKIIDFHFLADLITF